MNLVLRELFVLNKIVSVSKTGESLLPTTPRIKRVRDELKFEIAKYSFAFIEIQLTFIKSKKKMTNWIAKFEVKK